MSGHVPAPEAELEQHAYDVCRNCGKPIREDIYTGGWATMVGRNFECYGQRS